MFFSLKCKIAILTVAIIVVSHTVYIFYLSFRVFNKETENVFKIKSMMSKQTFKVHLDLIHTYYLTMTVILQRSI